jgi:hypothetical protein
MSTEFNFPADPEIGDTVTLPDGGQAQWNGYAWITLGSGSSVDYPITIDKGGTSATTLSEAQLNLIIGLTNIDTTEPATPKYGDRWIRPDNMTEQVWVPNADSTSGVWINPAGGGGSGGDGVPEAPDDGAIYGRGATRWIDVSSPGIGWLPYVQKSGDEMSGNLLLPILSVRGNNTATIQMNKVGDLQGVQVIGTKDENARWGLLLGNYESETGTDSGSDFSIDRYSDLGAITGTPFKINRATGQIDLGEASQPGVTFLANGRLTFPVVKATNTDAYTLDDYKEADTWSPTNTAGLVLTINSSSYTKIGRLVYISLWITLPTNTSAESFQLSGLPYDSVFPGALAIGYQNAPVVADSAWTVMVNGNVLNVYANGGFATFAQWSGAQIYMGGCYQTST